MVPRSDLFSAGEGDQMEGLRGFFAVDRRASGCVQPFQPRSEGGLEEE